MIPQNPQLKKGFRMSLKRVSEQISTKGLVTQKRVFTIQNKGTGVYPLHLRESLFLAQKGVSGVLKKGCSPTPIKRDRETDLQRVSGC